MMRRRGGPSQKAGASAEGGFSWSCDWPRQARRGPFEAELLVAYAWLTRTHIIPRKNGHVHSPFRLPLEGVQVPSPRKYPMRRIAFSHCRSPIDGYPPHTDHLLRWASLKRIRNTMIDGLRIEQKRISGTYLIGTINVG